MIRQLPPGVRDLFGGPARQLSRLSATLQDLFERWGYSEVRPPTFEYFDNVMRAFDEDFAPEIYRLVDPEGQLLALRPDLTVPVARLVATKLYDQPMPQRLSYVAPVFRFSEPNSLESREIWQGGWELIGVASPAADAEVIALLIAAMEVAGLTEFQVNLGHMGFVRATLADAHIADGVLAEVLRAIDRKNRKVLIEALDQARVDGPARAVLVALPDLWGHEEVLAQALALAPNPPASDALHHLQAVLHLLECYGVAERVTVDLGEVRGMDYYTGVTFELFARGSGDAIASGGRYDNLLHRFGADLPAVGAMMDLERVLRVHHRTHGTPAPTVPDALQQHCDHPACLRALRERRRTGKRVELDLLERPLADLHVEARQRGIAHVIACQATPTDEQAQAEGAVW